MSVHNPVIPDFSRHAFLIVEDFEGMRATLRNMLARAGATRIDLAANADAALAQLERNQYHAVLCDLNLGQGLNGQQLLEEVRHQQWLPPHTAWLMVSAEKTPEMVLGTAESRPDDYLIKPLSESLLFTRLRRQLERKHLLAPIEQAMHDQEFLRALRLVEAQLDTGSPYAWDLKRLKADLAMHMGDYNLAREVFQDTLTQRDQPWARLGLAKLHHLEGRLAEARSELEQLTRGNLAFLDAADWLARTLEHLGDLDSAKQVLVRAVSASPKSPARQARLGEVAYRLQDMDTAGQAFRRTIDLARGSRNLSADPYLWLSRVCLAQEDKNAALLALATLNKDFKGDDAIRFLARSMEIPIWFRSGERDKAEEIAAEVSGSLPGQAHNLPPEASFDLAPPLIQLGRADTAGALLSSVVGNNHDHPEYRERAQAVYTEAGMETEGKQLLEQAARAATDIMDHGVKLAREGSLKEAIALTREARKQMPNNPRLLLNHAFLLIAWMEQYGRDLDLTKEVQACIASARRQKPDDKRAGELLGKLELVGCDFLPD